jgi:hypothetical protein
LTSILKNDCLELSFEVYYIYVAHKLKISGFLIKFFYDCFGTEHNTSVRKYWKTPFYPSNTDTGPFYGGSTDIDIDVQYPKLNNDILVYPVFSGGGLVTHGMFDARNCDVGILTF